MGVTQGVDGNATEQVDVLLAVLVPDVRPVAAHQRQLRLAERVDEGGGVALLDGSWVGHSAVLAFRVLVSTPGSTCVPTPSSVKISSRTACGSRPSTTVVRGTPPRIAARQAVIFGTIPLASVGSIASSASGPISPITSSLSGQFSYRPSTSVRTSSFSAPSATARAAAAVSALTLWTAPSGSGATEEITGIRPASMTSSTASGRTEATSPTRPRSTSSPSITRPVRWAVNRPPSSPERPTARGPCWLIIPTSSRWTWPTRTIRTTSIASSVVTLRPPLNSLSMPSRSSIWEICGPPPWTTTGLNPAIRRNTTSSANAFFSSSSTIALPPYFTTMILPWYFINHGRAAASVAALAE